MVPCAPTNPHSRRHLDRFILFRSAYTDRQTDHATAADVQFYPSAAAVVRVRTNELFTVRASRAVMSDEEREQRNTQQRSHRPQTPPPVLPPGTGLELSPGFYPGSSEQHRLF